jgi:hypothetical protein
MIFFCIGQTEQWGQVKNPKKKEKVPPVSLTQKPSRGQLGSDNTTRGGLSSRGGRGSGRGRGGRGGRGGFVGKTTFF